MITKTKNNTNVLMKQCFQNLKADPLKTVMLNASGIKFQSLF